MGNEGLLRGLTMTRPPGLAKLKRQKLRAYLIFLIPALVPTLFLIIYGYSYDVISNAWNTGDWGDFWLDFMLKVGLPLMAAAHLSFLCSVYLHERIESRTRIAQALPLREAAASGSEQVAPLATNQPAPLDELPLGVASWGPFKPPPDSKRDLMIALGIICPALGFLILVSIPSAGSDLDSTTALALGITATLLLGSGLLCLLWLWRMSTDMTVMADEWTLTWRRYRWWNRQNHMNWHDARAFYTFYYEKKQERSLYGKPYQVYVLDAPDATLAWMVPVAPERVSPADLASLINKRFQQPIVNKFLLSRLGSVNLSVAPVAPPKDHERFCQLIAARTRLPLRDLTAAAEELVDVSELPLIVKLKRQLSDQPEDLAWLRSRPKKRRLPTLWYVALTPLLVLGLLAGFSWGLQLYESHQYEQMLAQVHTHRPLYHDALSAPDADWPIRLPSANAPGSFTYKDGAYQLTGNYAMDALAPGIYGDVEIEVTVRLYSPNPNDQYTNFGLLPGGYHARQRIHLLHQRPVCRHLP